MTRPWPIRVGGWLLTLLAVPSGTIAARPQTEPTPTFPARVELITVDAVVVDAKGNPVQGLTRDDFVIREEGEPQEITSFEAILPPGPGEAAGGPAEAAPTPPPRIATNASPSPTGSTVLLVVDDIHLTGIQAVEAKKALERFLRESVGPGDRVTMVSTATGAAWSGTLPTDRDDLLAFVNAIQGRNTNARTQLMTEYEAMRIALYNDAQALRSAVGRYLNQGACPSSSRPLPGTGNPQGSASKCDTFVQGSAQSEETRNKTMRAASLGGIERAILGLGRQRGRKTVLLLTEGFIHDAPPEDGYPRVVAAAQRANAAIYFVDLHGTEGAPASASAEAAPEIVPSVVGSLPDNPLMPEEQKRNLRAAQERGAQASQMMAESRNLRFTPQVTIGVETMADDTGGLLVRNTNDLAGRLNRISTESRSYYLLGYRPNLGAGGSAFRKIEVKVKRGGVTVRARKGYSGESPGTLVPLRLATYTLEPRAEKKTRVVAVTEIDVSGLTFQEHEGRRVAQLDVRLEAAPRDGGNVQGSHLSIEAEAPDVKAMGAPFWRPLRVELALPTGVYEVRATVASATNQDSGVASQRVVVPDPSAFRVSTPVLSEAATPAADATARPLPVPMAHDLFTSREGQRLYCGFQVFGATKDPSAGRFDVVSQFVLRTREGRTLAAPPPSPMALSPNDQLERVLVLPLAQLTGGEYELALTVEDRVAGKKQTLVQPFSVFGPPVAARETPRPPSLPTQGETAPVPPKLAPILALAGGYVVEYGSAFSKVVAQEDYRQEYPEPNRPQTRFSRADLVFVTLPGPIPWATFRDVYEVDGHKLHDRNARLEKLFVESSGRDAVDQANAIIAESSRINLGPVHRTVNIPTLALLFLHPDVQGRFTFVDRGRGKVAGLDAVQIGFTERARPTVVGCTPGGAATPGDVPGLAAAEAGRLGPALEAGNGGGRAWVDRETQRWMKTSVVGCASGGEVPASGRVWIDPETGAVLRTDVGYDFTLEKPREEQRIHARVVTEYRREKGLGILVPSEMREWYEVPLDAARGGNIFKDERDEQSSIALTAVAQYAGYRRFEVTTDEAFRPTDKQ